MSKLKQLKIKNINPVCSNFWGNGAVYHCYAEMPDDDNRQYTPDLAEVEADRAGAIRLKFARTFYGWYGYDKNKKAWTWETPECKALYRWLQRIKDRGIVVALNTGWCCPGDVNSTCWNGESPFTVPGDWSASVQNYADWVSETVHQLIEVRGFDNIKVFTLFTEPQYLSGEYSKSQIKAYGQNMSELQKNAWMECAERVDSALKRDKRRDKILLMGPNEGSVETSDMLRWVVEQKVNIDIYASHSYQFSKEFVLQPGMTQGPNGKVPLLYSPGGRIFQKVQLKKGKNYTLKVKIFWMIPDILHVSGTIVFGAFSTELGTINTGGEPTNRLSYGSTDLINPALAKPEVQEYSVNFNSESCTEAFVGIYHDLKQPDAKIVLQQMSLTEQGKTEQLLKNFDFKQDFEYWKVAYAGASTDFYNDWCSYCKTALQYVPKNKLFIYDEYNCVYDRNNSRINHGSNIVNAAVAYMNSGCNGSMLWTLFDQQWPNCHTTNSDSFVNGDHQCGVAPLLSKSLIPHLSYYAFGLLSRYTGGWGSKVYKGVGTQNLHTTMNILPDGNITLVVVNNKATSDEFVVNFDLAVNKTLYRHCFDPSAVVPNSQAILPGVDAEFKVEKTLKDSIRPFSVTIYTSCND